QERRAPCYVLHAPVFARDAEASNRLAVPVGKQREVQVERLHPGHVRPRRVARGGHRPYTCLLELLAPVTQELHFVRSGARPVEKVEEHEDRPFLHEVTEGERLAWSEPDLGLGDGVAHAEHDRSLTRAAPAFDCREDSLRGPARVELRRETRHGLDLADICGADEEPLVGARPAEQQPAAGRRPGDGAEPPEATEEEALAPQRVGVDAQQLAARPEPSYDRDTVALRREGGSEWPARKLERLQTTTIGVEDDEREATGEPPNREQPSAVG